MLAWLAAASQEHLTNVSTTVASQQLVIITKRMATSMVVPLDGAPDSRISWTSLHMAGTHMTPHQPGLT
jgi:hypothetical protein